MRACLEGHIDVVKLLLDYPVIKLNAREVLSLEVHGRTAFQLACEQGHFNVAELLLNYIDDPETQVKYKKILKEKKRSVLAASAVFQLFFHL